MFLCVKHFPLKTFGEAVHNSLGKYLNLQALNYIVKLLNFPISCYLDMQLALDLSQISWAQHVLVIISQFIQLQIHFIKEFYLGESCNVCLQKAS